MLLSSDAIKMIDANTRRIVRSFGTPILAMKIYDKIGEDVNLEALLEYMRDRKMNEYAFVGVGHIFVLPNAGPVADIQVYGRVISGISENLSDVYPFSMLLANGEDLPDDNGRACLEETVIFGKEAELYLSVSDPKVDNWLKQFAV